VPLNIVGPFSVNRISIAFKAGSEYLSLSA
jgi:hypothetical protein